MIPSGARAVRLLNQVITKWLNRKHTCGTHTHTHTTAKPWRHQESKIPTAQDLLITIKAKQWQAKHACSINNSQGLHSQSTGRSAALVNHKWAKSRMKGSYSSVSINSASSSPPPFARPPAANREAPIDSASSNQYLRIKTNVNISVKKKHWFFTSPAFVFIRWSKKKPKMFLSICRALAHREFTHRAVSILDE